MKHLDGVKVLIADDFPDTVLWTRMVLRHTGAVVRDCHDGLTCIAEVLADAPDVILLDMMMPDCTGLETTRTLRDVGFRGWILGFSAKAFAEDRAAALAAGCNDYLTKPCGVVELIEAIENGAKVSKTCRRSGLLNSPTARRGAEAP